MKALANQLGHVPNVSYRQNQIVSPLLWKAFHLSSVCHGLYPFPVQWDASKREFNVNQNQKQIQAWTLVVIFLVFGVGSVLCPYLFLINLYLRDSDQYITAYFLLIYAILSLISWQVGSAIVFYRHELALFFNSMLKIELNLVRENTSLSTKDHVFGAVVLYITFIFAIFPYTSVPVAIFVQMDPFSYFLFTHCPSIFSQISTSISLKIISFTIITSIGLIIIIVASQIYAFILLYMSTTLLIYSKLLTSLSTLPLLTSRIKSYKVFYILHQIYFDPAAISCGASLTVGFILSIMLAIVGLQGFGKFPFTIYLYSEITEVTILILVYILLPQTFQVYEKSKRMIRGEWKMDLIMVHGISIRMLEKELNALRPIYFGFYKILRLTKGWGAAYVFYMVDSIMDFCLSVKLD